MEYKPSFQEQLDVDYICHHGIKGMHWGIRRYQNPDGSLTSAGTKRYNKHVSKQDRIADKGDKLRAKGLTLDGRLALTKGQRAAGLAGVAGAGALQFAVPVTSGFPMIGVASTLMAMDVQNRKAIQASIAREKRTKMKEVRKKNAERQRKINRQLNAVKKDREDAFKKVYGKNAKLDFMKIYTEMSKDKRFENLLESEDPDDYRAAEAAWRKKHGV